MKDVLQGVSKFTSGVVLSISVFFTKMILPSCILQQYHWPIHRWFYHLLKWVAFHSKLLDYQRARCLEARWFNTQADEVLWLWFTTAMISSRCLSHPLPSSWRSSGRSYRPSSDGLSPTYEPCLGLSRLSFKMSGVDGVESGKWMELGRPVRRRSMPCWCCWPSVPLESLRRSRISVHKTSGVLRMWSCIWSRSTRMWYLPSKVWMPAGIKYAKGALHLHSMFNLAQMLQGENVPANVSQLQESIKRDGVEALRFYILFLLGFMSGDSAAKNQLFLLQPALVLYPKLFQDDCRETHFFGDLYSTLWPSTMLRCYNLMSLGLRTQGRV